MWWDRLGLLDNVKLFGVGLVDFLIGCGLDLFRAAVGDFLLFAVNRKHKFFFIVSDFKRVCRYKTRRLSCRYRDIPAIVRLALEQSFSSGLRCSVQARVMVETTNTNIDPTCRESVRCSTSNLAAGSFESVGWMIIERGKKLMIRKTAKNVIISFHKKTQFSHWWQITGAWI